MKDFNSFVSKFSFELLGEFSRVGNFGEGRFLHILFPPGT